jgi:hypothetical protein
MSAGEAAALGDVPAGGLRAELDRIQSVALIAGLAGTAAILALGLVWPHRAGPAYLVGYLFWVGIALGCVSLTMLHHLTGGNWGLVIRRPMEAGAGTLILLAVLFLPLWFLRGWIYPWVHPEGELVHVVEAKEVYLNSTAWTIRTIVYFAIWIGMGLALAGLSRRQDRTESTQPSDWLETLSGPGMGVIFLTGTFAAIDWIMSLEPAWYSTIYGAMVIVGWGLATFATMIVVTRFLSRHEPIAALTTAGRLNDLGNLLLAFTMLWAYLSFSQYLIIWAGNLTEEIPWYLRRTRGGWGWIASALILFQFFLPFFLLLSRDLKRRVETLAVVAGVILVMRLVDLAWLVVPASNDPSHPQFAPVTLLLVPVAAVGIGGLWVWMLVGNLKARPLIPVRDPHVREALAHPPE